mmetsp:Transcript_60296/g.141044  ORF Transcript_60296/g.141044 Transcript_60296/m.141044 type:complete len:409 (+) Transcript_60296:1726-2952(+)
MAQGLLVLVAAFQLQRALQVNVAQAVRSVCLRQLQCLIPFKEVAVHVQRSLWTATLQEVLSRLREVPEEGRHMTAKEELVLDSLDFVQVHHHSRSRRLSVCLLCPGDVQALQAPSAQSQPQVSRIQGQSDLESQGEAIQRQGLKEAALLSLESIHDMSLAAHIMRVQPQVGESTAALLADYSTVRNEDADLAVLKWSRRGLDMKLGICTQIQLAQTPHPAFADLHLAVDERVQIKLVASNKYRGIRTVPQDAISGVGEVGDGNTIIVDRIVQPGIAGVVNQGNSSSLVIGIALPNSVRVLVLIDLLAIYQGIVLQTTVGVSVDQEVAHNGGTSDTTVILLSWEDGCLPVTAAGFDLVQVHTAVDQDASVGCVQAYALHAADVLLLVDLLDCCLIRAGIEPDSVVHSCR